MLLDNVLAVADNVTNIMSSSLADDYFLPVSTFPNRDAQEDCTAALYDINGTLIQEVIDSTSSWTTFLDIDKLLLERLQVELEAAYDLVLTCTRSYTELLDLIGTYVSALDDSQPSFTSDFIMETQIQVSCNKSIPNIPQCTSPISHIVPFRTEKNCEFGVYRGGWTWK